MISHDDKTIIAQCTPKGSGAIALIRISGSCALLIASEMAKLSKDTKLADITTHTISFGKIVNEDGLDIDQVMFMVMKAPKTFTGENIVEISCHNNPFIIEEIINLAIKKGARLAQPGEFARRAVLNGKMDILQAESINEVINAHTQQSLKKSLSQVEGSFSNWVSKAEQKLLRCLALSEASFEFIDEEIEFGSQICAEIQNVLQEIQNIKRNFNYQKQIKEGIRVAIIGSVNAGKSSLFNVLLSKDRAIVSDIAGTTRDSIEAGIYTKDHYMTLVDTAGLRQTNNMIESEGIKRSIYEAEIADIILLVFDSSREFTKDEFEVYNKIINSFHSKIILVANKSDVKNDIKRISYNLKTIDVSTKNKSNIETLEIEIKSKISSIVEKCDAPFLLNKRHINLLADLENKLLSVLNMLKGSFEYELLSIHLNEAIMSIGELTGRNVSEKGMDLIFKEFCVGK